MTGVSAEGAAGVEIERVLVPVRQEIETRRERRYKVAALLARRREDIDVIGFVELCARKKKERAQARALGIGFGPGPRENGRTTKRLGENRDRLRLRRW